MDSDIFCENLLESIGAEIKDDWPYKILSKKSASPSLLVLTGNGVRDTCPRIVEEGNESLAIKTWCRTESDDYNQRDPVDEEGALGYEKKVYVDKIKGIMEANVEDPDNPSEYVPILRYVGDDGDCSTVETLARFIGIDLESESSRAVAQRGLLYLAFYVNDAMVRDPGFEDVIKPLEFNKVDFYRRFFLECTQEGKARFVRKFSNDVKYWKIGAVLMPRTRFRTFDEYIGTEHQSGLMVQVVKGLYMVNKAGLVHNDLHCGNIMVKTNPDGIEPVRKVMIYDWDRGYSPSLGPNPLLNIETNRYLCKTSQCNIFMGQRPVDLLKILRYVVDSRDNFFDILQNGLKLPNNFVDGLPRYDVIHSALKRCSPGKNFYTFEGHSALYKVGHCPRVEHAIALLGGTWDVIFRNIFPDLEIRAPDAGAVMAMNEKGVNSIPEYLIPLANIFAEIVNEKFSCGIIVDRNDVEVVEELESSVNLYSGKVGSASRRVRFGVLRDISSVEDRFYFIKIQNLEGKKCSELSWTEFNKLRNVADYVKFGSPKIFRYDFTDMKEDSGRDFSEILVENEDRKAKLLKEMRASRNVGQEYASKDSDTLMDSPRDTPRDTLMDSSRESYESDSNTKEEEEVRRQLEKEEEEVRRQLEKEEEDIRIQREEEQLRLKKERYELEIKRAEVKRQREELMRQRELDEMIVKRERDELEVKRAEVKRQMEEEEANRQREEEKAKRQMEEEKAKRQREEEKYLMKQRKELKLQRQREEEDRIESEEEARAEREVQRLTEQSLKQQELENVRYRNLIQQEERHRRLNIEQEDYLRGQYQLQRNPYTYLGDRQAQLSMYNLGYREPQLNMYNLPVREPQLNMYDPLGRDRDGYYM
jgi:hypothetical protein